MGSPSKSKSPSNNQSTIDPTRKTVGAIYREAALKNSDQYIECGDLTRELCNSLCDDINETASSNPFDNEPFYITVYEKKDLQMQRAILRRLYVTKYRPYPEDDTLVFYVEPKSNKVKFCWCLPHHTEMDNMLLNFTLYNKDLIADIQAWKEVNLDHFGFLTDGKSIVPKLVQERDKLVSGPEISIKIAS